MSDIQSIPVGFISPYSDYSLRNTQALSGVSHLWQDFFARALAEQRGDGTQVADDQTLFASDPAVEPKAGSDVLAQIVNQRHCSVQDTEIRPPEPLFLPIAEFEMDLLDKPFPPFPPEELKAQQEQQDFDSSWVRPVVINNGQPVPEPGPAPQKKPLYLPIAEFDLDLMQKPYPPFPPEEIVEQQKALDFDNGWARPIVLQNLRIAA